jgi:hypothetical protein
MTAKRYKISADQMRPLAPGRGACIATDHITVDGKKVGYMYREAPRDASDSGWHFFSGSEGQGYVDNSKNLGIYDVNTIVNYDAAVLPYLDAPIGNAFGRVSGTDRFKIENLTPK